ncbi:EamA family transporter RarD [Nitrincola tapanii]|uniref:EamA family transporter RarD n=1 Tax=Nitrincola tapanii TaxID=1708751 RepID=A0A5A9WAI2_9GAMM|nr:EamA family transporter RarD [Nitrincola tapanii]KAA0876441.1 EamA family transporter RarD [Nitrincola tapanii]
MPGIWLALGAYVLWGCFPLYFYHLSHVSPPEILANRIVWSLAMTLIFTLIVGRMTDLWRLLGQSQGMFWLAVSAQLLAGNWLLFIWAVGQQRAVEASLGFFITPLVSLLLGWLILKERLHPLQGVAAVIAASAILWEMFSLGHLPWVSLGLAFSFGLYGLVRKQFPVDALNGLTVETLWMTPMALIWLGWIWSQGEYQLALGSEMKTSVMLLLLGVVTAVPLLLYNAATKRLDLSLVGFIMYINPTLQFLIAVFVLQETSPPQRMVTFLLIWIALAFFVAGLWRRTRTYRKIV